jgi:hypothetical protein
LGIAAIRLVSALGRFERTVLASQVIYFLDELNVFAHDAAAFILVQLPDETSMQHTKGEKMPQQKIKSLDIKRHSHVF